MNSLHSIHSWTRGVSVRGGKYRLHFSFQFDNNCIRSLVRDDITSLTAWIPFLSSSGVFAFVVASELHHWLGLTMSVFSSSLAQSAGRSLMGFGSHGIQLFGTLIQSFSTTQFVWNLSIQRACTWDGQPATRSPRVSHIPLMIPSSPYRPCNTGMMSS